ncbi:hypothetical protein HYC85_015609 [Camellia sinensis]|uniref:F-box/LRR-repeat protein 15/At3g58940/PEG3-like LRR domain-containing protein n=1 Tax=Camellia sinensis TaxID=4442 RepID=A0A7J7GZH9_CAMSI|nr:hypothetical protein HYC85_015609 [Camellia sinensis]
MDDLPSGCQMHLVGNKLQKKMNKIVGNMKKLCGPTSDIITYLPDNVKETILMSLPLQDVVRTKNRSEMRRINFSAAPPVDQYSGSLFLYLDLKAVLRSTSWYFLFQTMDLTLHSCMFKPPPEKFKGFRSLLRLELCKVAITANIFSSLISSCPLLEELTLEGCSSLDCLEIEAPNRIFLFCESHVRSICFKNTPHLAKVSIGLKVHTNEETLKEGETSNMVLFFDSLPAFITCVDTPFLTALKTWALLMVYLVGKGSISSAMRESNPNFIPLLDQNNLDQKILDLKTLSFKMF